MRRWEVRLVEAQSQHGPDNWELGSATFAGRGAPASEHEFIQMVQYRSGQGGGASRVVAWLLALVLVAIGGWLAYEMFYLKANPLDRVMKFFNVELPVPGPAPELAEEPKPEAPQKTDADRKAEKAADAKANTKAKQGKRVTKRAKWVAPAPIQGNPYWALPNKLLGNPVSLNRPWSPDEEETWRAGLAHKYPYQHWKTVMEIRERKLKGSDSVLWDAMQDRKFWVRMYAAVGLAEMNVELSLQSIEAAIGKERSELVADFFERIIQKPGAGHAYVLRQVIRLLDAKGRLVVLQGIANRKDELRELYLAAATQDPSKQVKRWVTKYLALRPINPDHYNDLLQIVQGKEDGEYLYDHTKMRSRADVTVDSARTEMLGTPNAADRLVTGEDLDNKDQGDVEFYEEDEEPVQDEPDAETYEYDAR